MRSSAAPSPLAVVPELFAELRASIDYRPTKPLRGRTFKKHLYPLVGEMNKPELDLAVVLDTLPEVAVWLRNMERHPRSFRLPYPSDASDWFSPDFLARLTDARAAVIEYKGKHLEPADEGKRQIGLAWERAMRGNGILLWIGDSGGSAQGRGIGPQVQDVIRR